MGRIPTFILAVVMASALVVGLGHEAASGGHGVQLSTAGQPTEGTEPTVTVVGEGTASVNPDVAWLNIGVETSGPTASETAQENQGKMDQVMASLQGLGITDQDIQTSAYNISPEYNSEQGQLGQVTGYRVSNTIRVTVRNLEQVGQVLDAVTQTGANSIYGITFGLEDPSAPQVEARAKAVADAQARAENLAKLDGYQLGGLLAISEDTGGGAVPMANTVNAAPIQPGQLQLHSRVQVTYAMH